MGYHRPAVFEDLKFFRSSPFPPQPQHAMDRFWRSHVPATAGLPSSVLPRGVYAELSKQQRYKTIASSCAVTQSYQSAREECEAKVSQIVAECRRTNTKYTDTDFNLDNMYDCLVALTAKPSSDAAAKEEKGDTDPADTPSEASTVGKSTSISQQDGPSKSASGMPIPACAKRVDWIFDEPQFYINKRAHVRDIRQGAEGDCWFISSLGSLCVDTEVPFLVKNIAPPSCRDELAGVYGFIFYRDGEWIAEVVDDKLYLKVPDYDDCTDERRTAWDASHSQFDPEVSRKLWKQTYQSNSDALFFASCAHPQETWVPLIEKAFAKVHGDYAAIDGGWPGEGVEDLTGGVTTEIVSAGIGDRNELWEECFLHVNRKFLIGAGTRQYRHPDPYQKGRQGIEDGHAYSVLRAVDYESERLLMVKNPWGKVEWTGPWSDGSKEWTAQALQDLDYKFGNEGIFWMPYDDFLERFVQVWRTRLFSPEWSVSQRWTTIRVPWSGANNPTVFEFIVTSPTPTVIALSQLDSRYYGGLTGQYSYELAFRLHRQGNKDYIIRGYSSGGRSAVAEVDLKPGRYAVLMKVEAYRDSTQPTIQDVVEQNWVARREKFIRTGIAYETAHAKGETIATAKRRADMAWINRIGETTKTDPSVRAEDEPWHAALVVGLKVFCQDKAVTLKERNLSQSSRSRRRWGWLNQD